MDPRLEHNTPLDAAQLLETARQLQCPASLRVVGGHRILGALKVSGLEPGLAIHLLGAHRRDQLIPVGTVVTLTLMVGDLACHFQVPMLEPIVSAEGDTLFPPVLRVGWPSGVVQSQRRSALRVGTPDLPPLGAHLDPGSGPMDARVVNLTELGMGLDLASGAGLHPGDRVRLSVDLPAGDAVLAEAEVRHVARHRSQPGLDHVGLVLRGVDPWQQERLQTFLQARRTDRCV